MINNNLFGLSERKKKRYIRITVAEVTYFAIANKLGQTVILLYIFNNAPAIVRYTEETMIISVPNREQKI